MAHRITKIWSLLRNRRAWKPAARSLIENYIDSLPPARVGKTFGRAIARKVAVTRLNSESELRRIIRSIEPTGPTPQKWLEMAFHHNLQGNTHLAQACIDAARRGHPDGIPLSVQNVSVLLTYRCNGSCPHCYIRQSPARQITDGPELTAMQFIQVLTRSNVLKTAHLTFSGGEIFLRDDLEEIFQAVAENGQSFSINTNGSLPEKISKLLANEKIKKGLKGIQVSLDGTREIHDKIRGTGSFDRLRESIGIAREHGIPARSQTVIQALNQDRLGGVVKASKSLGCVSHDFNVELQKTQCFKPKVQYIHKYLSGRALVFYCGKDIYTGVGCASGMRRIEIQPDGRVLPCAMAISENLSFLCLGELKKYDFDFDHLWMSGQAGKARADVRKCPGCNNPCWR